MKLTDQEQVILKAIERVGRNGLALISEVIRAVGYPKATTKKVLVRLSEKGAVSLHRHDWPRSLKPEQRKLLVRIGRDYFSAVSMRKRNPKKKISYVRWEVDYIKPLYVYIKYEPDLMDLSSARSDALSSLTTEFGAHTHNAWRIKGEPTILSKLPDDVWEVKGSKGWAWIGHRRKKNPSKGKAALKTAGKAVKGFAQGALSAASQILGAGATALNPKGVVYKAEIQDDRFRVFVKGHPQNNSGWIKYNSHSEPIRGTQEARREAAEFIRQVKAGVMSLRNPSKRIKIKNKYIDLVIKGQAKKTPQGWLVGKKTFAQGWGTVNVSSGYYLDRHTGMVYAKRARNPKGWYELVEKWGPAQRTLKKSKSIETLEKERAKLSPERQQKTWIEDFQGNVVAGYRGHAGWRPNPKRRRNSDKKDSDHPIEVTKHWRAGPPGYLTPWQRAHHAGQKQLFETGIKPAKKRNPRKGTRRVGGKSSQLATRRRPTRGEDYSDWSLPLLKQYRKQVVGHLKWLGQSEPKAAAVVRQRLADVDAELKRRQSKKRNAARSVHPRKTKTSRARTVTKARNRSGVRSVAKARKASTKRSARRNPSAESIRKKFAGRVTGERDVFVPSSTPKGKLAKLGNLVLIQTEQGTIKPVRGTAVLLADTRGKLHIGTTGKTDLFSGPRQSFGYVKRVEYESSKPHLGYASPIIWHHKLGEETGERPTLYADGQGGLVFRGGRYRLTRRGIEN
jgi:hypothetical protein